jgi:hypothetical protein
MLCPIHVHRHRKNHPTTVTEKSHQGRGDENCLFDLLPKSYNIAIYNHNQLQQRYNHYNMVQQNIALCLLFSVLAGLMTILARAVVLKQVQREKKQMGSTSRYQKHLSSLLFFLLEVLSNTFSFIGPWFGPASLALPMLSSAKLLFNLFIIGGMLQRETFDKKVLVGTVMVAIGVVYLSINGPQPQDNQDLVEIIVKDPAALTWLGLATVGYVVSVGMMLFCDLKRFSPRSAEAILLLVSTFSKLSNTVSKAASLAGDYGSVYRGVLTGLGLGMLFVWTISTMKEPRFVRSFVTYGPTDILVGLLFNLGTGVSN